MEGIAFLVLGPLEVRNAGQPVPLRGTRERAVLAALLLAKGRLVPMAALVEATWSGQPPDAAGKAVRNAVSALRGRLSRAGGTGLIETSTAGYRLPLAGVYLDVVDFAQRVAEARTLAGAGQPGPAAETLRAALDLWRGPALGGTGGPVLEAAAARLDEQRLAALEDCVDLELALGRHRELTGELRTLTSEWPLRERLAAQLMLALYRSGQQDEALDAYRSLTRRLADELGLDPSPAVAALHNAILRHDLALAYAPPGADTGASALEEGHDDVKRPRPAQLPLDVSGFTGRAAELARLHALLPSGGSGPGGATVVISAIGGTAGVGKTALAVRFAHEAAARFPDGQLYVNLRGFGPSGLPVKPEEALRGFLRALGVAPGAIPAEVTAQAGLYRTLLAGRRMLVLLDNAADAAQVRPLLPGSDGCLVLVTSRQQLTGLAAAEGARLLTLDVLTEQEARDLLARRLGEERLSGEPAAVGELIGRCARLPLALAIAAARAAARPALTLGQLAAELRRPVGPLDALDTGDQATSLRAVFSWSLRTLPTGPARLFVLLGAHPGPDFDAYAAAALAGTTLDQARRWLDVLAGTHLIQPAPGRRCTMHDLLRAYAADLAADPGAADPAAVPDLSQSRAALERLLDYYLATAAAAMDLARPAERRPHIPAAVISMPDLPDADTAVAWLDTERPDLVAVTAYAAGNGWPRHAIRLSGTLYRHLLGKHPIEGLAIHRHARDAARQMGDHTAEAEALRHLGVVHWRLGDNAQAAGHFDQALTLYQRTDDRIGHAYTLNGLGTIHWQLGNRTAAIRHQEQALALLRKAGDLFGQGLVLSNLGDDLAHMGRYREAVTYLQEALALARRVDDREGEAYALNNLGQAEHGASRAEQAAEHLRAAVSTFAKLGHQIGEAEARTNLGAVLTALGHPEQAAEQHRRALAVFRAEGNRGVEPVALNGLGEAFQAMRQSAEAVTHHSTALSLALVTGDREQQARAHAGLGHAFGALAEPRRTLEHLQQALVLYADLGYPEAEQIRTGLAACKHPG